VSVVEGSSGSWLWVVQTTNDRVPLNGRSRPKANPNSSATDLISLVSEAAKDAAHGERIHTALIQSEDQPEYFRGEAKIPLPEPLFDQLFNGRSGYRAQYYLSAAQGAAFNRMIVDALTPTALNACRCRPLANVRNVIARCLAGRYSKIWVIGDGAAFLNSPAALRPARWKDYW